MRKYLIPEIGKFYKANMHCHTTNSDGKMTPCEVKELYKKNGYSVVAFTDHDFITDNSYLNDEEFLALTGCELAIKEDERVSTLVKRNMKVCHLNFIAKEPHNVDTPCYSSVYDKYSAEKGLPVVHSCGEYKREYSPEKISEMIKTGNEKGFLVCYNHPRWSLENATDYLKYEGLWAVEIFNNSCDFSGIYEYNINVYDDFLRNGCRMGCISADDNHALKHACGGYIMIKAETLDYPSIIKALENHDYYASQGPVIKSLYLEDDIAYLTFEKGEYAVMSTAGRRVDKQTALNPDGENTVSFKVLLSEDGYIRFDVVDKYGKRANSCACFLSD